MYAKQSDETCEKGRVRDTSLPQCSEVKQTFP